MAKPFIGGTLQGMKGITAALRSLKTAVVNRVIRKGITAGIQVYAKALKQTAPKQTGLLRKSIGHKVKTYRVESKNAGKTLGITGPRRGFKREMEVKVKNKKGRTVRKYKQVRDPVRYAGPLEAKKPWLRPTFISKQQNVEGAAMTKMQEEMRKAFQDAARAANQAEPRKLRAA